MPGSGKEGGEFMEEVVYRSLGRKMEGLLVGPGKGLDNGVVSLGKGRVMIVTVDPVSAIPSLGMKLSAWLSVHLIASDYTASGNDPELAVFSYNFPHRMKAEDRKEFIRSVGRECNRLGVTIAAGHTGSYPGGGFTVIGSGVLLGFAPGDGYLTPAMARAGDKILMTKSAAIEATGSLSLSFPSFAQKKLGRALWRKAAKIIRECSTVEDARGARGAGLGSMGVTTMHDATEGGILGALDEMAAASGRRFSVDEGSIPVSPEAEATCASFGLDPLRTMGEGSLLLTCNPGAVSRLQDALSKRGIPATLIGDVSEGRGLQISRGMKEARAYRPGPDRYWSAYQRAIRSGLR